MMLNAFFGHADAMSYPALDFQVRRPEISIDDNDSCNNSYAPDMSQAGHDDDVMASGSNGSEATSLNDEAVSQASHADTVGDYLSETDQNNSVDRVIDHQISDCQSSHVRAESEVGEGMEIGEGVEMVPIYPEYLLHGAGLKLLELCLAMWSADPKARPTWEGVLDRLASI